jgi:hypothetical protein
MRDPVLAGVLSLIIPGVGSSTTAVSWPAFFGYLYSGFWLGTGGTLDGFATLVLRATCAVPYAKEHPIR